MPNRPLTRLAWLQPVATGRTVQAYPGGMPVIERTKAIVHTPIIDSFTPRDLFGINVLIVRLKILMSERLMLFSCLPFF